MCFFRERDDEATEDDDVDSTDSLPPFRGFEYISASPSPTNLVQPDSPNSRDPRQPSRETPEPTPLLRVVQYSRDDEAGPYRPDPPESPESPPSESMGDSDYSPGSSVSSSDDDDDDPLVKAMKGMRSRSRRHPPDIVFTNHVTDLSFHPSQDVVAVASIIGDVFLYRYSLDECELISTIEVHNKSCRAIEYSIEGDWFVSCGTDKTIMVTDTATGKLKQFYENSHENDPYCLYVLNDNIMCSGDEGGQLKVWDIREKKPSQTFKAGEEQISCMISNSAGKHLVCCATDCLAVFDLPGGKLLVESENYDDELLSLCLVKQDTKLIAGSSDGAMYVFNWGMFGYHTDLVKGPKQNINHMLTVTDNIVLTGTGDAKIRACSVYPHKQLGIVGEHSVSVESLDINHDGEWVGSVGFDETLRFWDIGYFEEMKVKTEKSRRTDLVNNLPSSRTRNPGEFFADLASII